MYSLLINVIFINKLYFIIYFDICLLIIMYLYYGVSNALTHAIHSKNVTRKSFYSKQLRRLSVVV